MIKKPTDIIKNAKLHAKELAKKKMLEQKRILLESSKVDVYTPKKIKHRIFTHERIKHKKEQKKV